MAKKRKSSIMKRKRKSDPAIMTLEYVIDPSGTTYQYIDLFKDLCEINRRSYRQGNNLAVAGFTVFATNDQTIKFEKLPSTWMTFNAWQKAFSAWYKQQEEVLDIADMESVKAAYSDFKIYFDEVHAAQGSVDLLSTSKPSPGSMAHAEWDYSQIVIPNNGAPGVNYEPYLHMLGGDDPAINPASIGLIQAYQASRSVPTSPDPNVPTSQVNSSENIYRQMFDTGDNNAFVLDNAVYKNNTMPYDQEQYMGHSLFNTEVVDFVKITTSTIGGTTRARGSSFPCGLVKLNLTEAESAFVLLVHLVPGNHRGYLAEPMGDY